MTKIRIDELLQQCTVKLSVLETGKVGTGFFVAPGCILTCRHVVQGGQTCSVRYGETKHFAMAEVVERWANLDMALLAFETTENLPCVMLDGALQPGDDLFLFGYPERDFPNGCPVTTSHEGITPGPPREIKFKAGQITPGMSGSPLLNQRTGKVCGMVTFTRDERIDLGGGAVPVDDILVCLSEEVKQANREFHQRDSRWHDALPKEPQTSPSLMSIPSNLQERGSSNFVGRDQTLKELHEKLQPGQTLAITALQGMGGIGKTEMAVQYAQRYKSHYPSGVCWLSARGADIGTQIVKFAVEELGLPQPEGELDAQLRTVWRYWPKQADGERVLLIYDDVADQLSVDGQRKINAYDAIKVALPTDRRFQVLLTTRLQNMAASKVKDFRLDLLSETVALELLAAIIGPERMESEPAVAQALCKWVGYLPLGLELLGYFLVENEDCLLAELLERLEDNRVHSEALKHDHSGMTAELGVIDAFELSWAQLSEDARALACWLSLFALAPIPWELVTAGTEADEQQKRWEKARNRELRKLSLLQRPGKDIYQLHQLVREFFLAKLEEREDKENLKEAYCGLMGTIASQMPQSPTQELISQMSPTVPHMEEVTTRWLSSIGDEENELLGPFVFLARFYDGQGAYAQAEPWYESGLKATLERFGEAHPDVATSLNNLAGLYDSQGRYGEAEPLYQESLALWKQLLGEAHPSV
ncbi:MAG: tetratricopeptide repeat protein, partial [Cyanobacteria bacterium P01_A01_bin.15]